ncbi:hypothetical protein GCM10009584_05370 [Ornithinimicrobium humiphilum]
MRDAGRTGGVKGGHHDVGIPGIYELLVNVLTVRLHEWFSGGGATYNGLRRIDPIQHEGGSGSVTCRPRVAAQDAGCHGCTKGVTARVPQEDSGPRSIVGEEAQARAGD